MPLGGELAEPLALLGGLAEDEDLAHEVLGHELERALAVAAPPGLTIGSIASPQPSQRKNAS